MKDSPAVEHLEYLEYLLTYLSHLDSTSNACSKEAACSKWPLAGPSLRHVPSFLGWRVQWVHRMEILPPLVQAPSSHILSYDSAAATLKVHWGCRINRTQQESHALFDLIVVSDDFHAASLLQSFFLSPWHIAKFKAKIILEART